MSSARTVKRDIERERSFRFINHFEIGDETIYPLILKLRDEVYRSVIGKHDCLNWPILADDNLIEIPGDQVQLLAKFLPIAQGESPPCKVQSSMS